MDALAETLQRQSGVISRRQLAELEVQPHAVRRMLRRRELVVVHAGVYLDHTGDPSWLQRAWAGVLALWPAALCGPSALRADDGPGRREDDARIHVAVDRSRSPAPPAGVVMRRTTDLHGRTLWNLSPPRIRLEHVVVDLAAEAKDEAAAVARLADAVQARRTTAARLRETVERRSRLARRGFLLGALRDIEEGTTSTLERGYLQLVERPHGLPRGRRQVHEDGVYRDVVYETVQTIVELDGRLFHDSADARDRDLERDLRAAVTSRATLRLGWGQVFGRPCSTARQVAHVLAARGWSGDFRRCGGCPTEECGTPLPPAGTGVPHSS